MRATFHSAAAAAARAMGGAGGDEDEDAAASGSEGSVGAEGGAGRSRRFGGGEEMMDTSSAAESPVCIAMGENWAAVGTDRDYLRFVRAGGVQDAVIAISGAIVAVAAHHALCAVVYHTGIPSGGRQALACDLFEYSPFNGGSSNAGMPRLIASTPLPLGPSALLQWLDFSSTGMLLAHSTHGVLFGLQAGLNWRWTPLCDTRAAARAQGGGKGRHDMFWPVCATLAPSSSATGGGGAGAGAGPIVVLPPGGLVPTLFAVFVRNAMGEPPVSSPAPMTDGLPLALPLLDAKAEMSAFDSSFLVSELFRLHRSWASGVGLTGGCSSASFGAAMAAASASLRGSVNALDARGELIAAVNRDAAADNSDAREEDKALLRMLQGACHSQRDVRAVNLASRLHLHKSITFAARIAESEQRPAVAERITQMLILRKAEAEGDVGMLGGGGGGASAAAPHMMAALMSPPEQQQQHQRKGGNFGLGGGGPPGATPNMPSRDAAPLPPVKGAGSRGISAGGGGSTNPFARGNSKRTRDGDAAAAAVEPAPATLNRQGSFIEEAHAKRAREHAAAPL